MKFTPSIPRTLAISWESAITEVVPWGRTALAKLDGESFELSMCMCESMNPGINTPS